MAMIAVWLKIDEERVVQALEEAGEKLDSVEGEVALDFSSVRRINPSAIEAISKFAGRADAESVKVVLRGVNVEVYKVLKLVKLGSRFSFVS
ncbi:MAG: STAS domain-containing protein [Candidatus Sulfotelmatobacter sp.]